MNIENPKEKIKEPKNKKLEPLKSENTEVDGKQGVMIPISKRCNFKCRNKSTWMFADLNGSVIFLCGVHRDKYTNYGERKND